MPVNEPVKTYAPGSAERESLVATLEEMYAADPVELTGVYGAERRHGGGELLEVRMPSEHEHVLGRMHQATQADTQQAIDAALAARPGWAELDFDSRAAIFLRVADLIAGPYRDRMNAATMLGQGKSIQQAEIDSACELIDFLRYNVAYARDIHGNQPGNSPTVWNRLDYRGLEGFVYAITPFNFSAIAGNLPTSAALMGNVVIWKPSVTQMLAAHVLAEILQEAGLPDGVINLVPGHGKDVSEVALKHPALAGIHFTGSTNTFHMLWSEVGQNISRYASYPRLVGETGGKNFIVAHPSADVGVVRTAMIRGAFEYSGQKCSAASRAYISRSVWEELKDDLVEQTNALALGDVRDLTNFTSAVIDKKAYSRITAAITAAKESGDADIVAGGEFDDSTGWFIRPTIIVSDNPDHDIFRTEYFGPVLGVYVYEDEDFEQTLQLVDETAIYALTGAIIANDRAAIVTAQRALRHAAGNFYINDKPTGAVVGQQPFGGARASGTNDKAGSMWNLMRWVSPRAVKETLVPQRTVDYPHMRQE